MIDQKMRDLIIIRFLDAPRDRVWKAWTEPKLLEKWWGPKGVTNPTCELDARPGGVINIVMLAGDELGELKGRRWPMTGTVRKIVPPKKLVFDSQAIMNDKPILETLSTLILEDQDVKTKMMFHIVVKKTRPEAEGPLAGMEMGWNQSLDKLTDLLKI